MTTDFDTLLRGTLNGLADRAPDEAGVRAALARRRGPRVALVAVAAAVLLVAVAVPFLRVGGPAGGVPPARFGVAVPKVFPVPLTATWLPPGFREGSRTAEADGSSVLRVWIGSRDEPVTFSLKASRSDLGRPLGTAIDLGEMGVGRYRADVDGHTVSWSFGEWNYRLNAPENIIDGGWVVDVARGLRTTPATPMRTAIEFEDLGSGEAGGYTVAGSADQQVHSVSATADFGVPTAVSADVTPVDPGFIGSPVTVGGYPATVDHPGSQATRVAVDLGDRWLIVRVHDESDGWATLLRVAEGVALAPPPENDWLGR